jgi:hypothetical protein
MPLDRSCSLDALRKNISAEIRAGREKSQAVAIAHQVLRNACKEEGKSVPKTDNADEGLQVLRYDSGEFSSPVRTPNGYLRCDARITKVGVFPYRLADNTVRRELRLPEEVFRNDALSSFEDVPMTNNHPSEKLTAKNTRRWQVGNIKQVGEKEKYVVAKVLITDEDTIKEVEGGKTELSCGYHCDLDFVSGTTAGIPGVADGLHYDAVQRNIVGNHLAIVDRGRAGADASLHLDAQDAIMIEETSKPAGPGPGPVGGKPMADKTLRIDGVDFGMSEQAAQAVAKMMARLDELEKTNGELNETLSQQRARADKAEEDLAAEKKARKEDSSDDKIREAVKARVDLVTTATGILKDDELDLSEMSELDIQKAVVLKMSPAAKDRLDSADAGYIQARFDGAVDAWKERPDDPGDQPDRPAQPRTIQVDGKRNDSISARERMMQHNVSLGRSPIEATRPQAQ